MRLAQWSDMTSLTFVFYASWLLLSKEGQARMATHAWIPTLIALMALVLIVVHLIFSSQA